MKTYNVGMIGYKFMGKAHSNAYSKLNMFFDTDYKVVRKAICGRDEAWVKQSAEKLQWDSYETDWKNLVIRPDIDIVDITAPSNFHKEVAIAAAKEGKHVFSEKPLALNVKDAREMLEAVQKAGVKHQIGFNYRFAPAIQLAKKMIDEGKLGELYHFRGKYLQDFIIDPNFPLVWRLDKAVAGSGSHGDLGAHVVDMARYLVGEFDRVIGMSKTFIGERPIVERMEGLTATADTSKAELGKVTVDDATLFMTEFKNGALGCFEATRFSQGHKNDMNFEINGSKGSIRFNIERINELEYYNEDDEAGLKGFRTIQVTEGSHPYLYAWWPVGHVLGYEHTFVHEMLEFTKAIHENTDTCPSFVDGVKCSQVLEAVDQSILESRWVQVDEI